MSIKLLIGAALAMLPMTEMNAFEWQCCFPKVKWYGCWEANKIDAEGIIELERTTVTEGLCVRGSVSTEFATISSAYIEGRGVFNESTIDGDISIVGTGIFNNTKIAGVTQVGGTLEGKCTAFCGGIQAATGFLELSNSTAPGIYMFPCADEMQIIKLSHDTCIDGSIVFEAGNGRVLVDSTSTVTGEVIGGFIIANEQ